MAAVLVGLPQGVRSQEALEMMQEKAAPFMHSSGLYLFSPPGGWWCNQLKSGDVECKTSNGATPGVCTITHQTIEGKLDSELMAINAERELKKLPHYRKTGGGRFMLGPHKASVRSFVFDYQGNTEYPIAVEELYVVAGGRAIRVHFETMAVAMGAYMGDLRRLYDTFSVADVDNQGAVVDLAKERSKKAGGKGSKEEEEINRRLKRLMNE